MGTSFDMIGDIAILEPVDGKRKEKELTKLIVKKHPGIRTILIKVSDRQGEHRTRKFRILKGTSTKTSHKEYGMQFNLDVAKAYFSPRESTERQRVASMIKPGEAVLVMFAGIGPMAISIARKQPSVGSVHAIEINPDAVECMEENIRVNRVGDKVTPVLGDVKAKTRPLYGKCDRVIMPLPLEAGKFLEIALKCLKKGGMIHFYTIVPVDDYSEAEALVKKACTKSKRMCVIKFRRKVLPYSPGKYKACLDIRVS